MSGVTESPRSSCLKRIATSIALLEANRFTQTMEEECRRMGRLFNLRADYRAQGGDEDALEREIARHVDRVERSMALGEYEEA